jgi:hypothetical protein
MALRPFACERLRESQSALSPPQEATLALLEGMAQLITGKGGHLPGMVDEYDRALDALEQALKLARGQRSRSRIAADGRGGRRLCAAACRTAAHGRVSRARAR